MGLGGHTEVLEGLIHETAIARDDKPSAKADALRVKGSIALNAVAFHLLTRHVDHSLEPWMTPIGRSSGCATVSDLLVEHDACDSGGCSVMQRALQNRDFLVGFALGNPCRWDRSGAVERARVYVQLCRNIST